MIAGIMLLSLIAVLSIGFIFWLCNEAKARKRTDEIEARYMARELEISRMTLEELREDTRRRTDDHRRMD
jgi:hypothetical protein